MKGAKVLKFEVFLTPPLKICYLLDFLFQMHPYNDKTLLQLEGLLSRFFDMEEFFKKTPFIDCEEWVETQLLKKFKNPTYEDIEKIYEKAKFYLFKYIVKSFLVDSNIFDSFAIGAYKRVCVLLIIEGAFEYLEYYVEGLRACRGKLKESFIKKFKK